MLLHGGEDPAALPENPTEEDLQRSEAIAQLIQEVEANYQSLASKSKNVTRVRLNGSTHGSFSDLVLAQPTDPNSSLLLAARGHEIISALSIAFFDRHLKGKAAELLDEIETTFEEASLIEGGR